MGTEAAPTAHVEAPGELLQSSFVVAGLFELAGSGELSSVTIGPRRRRGGALEPDQSGDFVEVERLARKSVFVTFAAPGWSRTVAIELSDSTTRVPADAVAEGMIVLRRSYRPDDAALVLAGAGVETLPLGLTFPVRSPAEPWPARRLASLVRATIAPALELRSGGLRRARTARAKLESELRGFRSAPLLPIPPSTAGGSTGLEAYVLFQTRTFGAAAPELAAERASVIRALRTGLGPRFRGGFVPDPWVASHFPDCVTSEPTTGSAYRALVRGAAVVVYTNGSLASPAWKLGEYLARGRAIVGQALEVELPEPLVDDRHWRCATDPDGLAEAAAALLDDEQARADLGHAARTYYEEHVEPGATMRRLIARIRPEAPLAR